MPDKDLILALSNTLESLWLPKRCFDDNEDDQSRWVGSLLPVVGFWQWLRPNSSSELKVPHSNISTALHWCYTMHYIFTTFYFPFPFCIIVHCKNSPMHISKHRLCWLDFLPRCTALWCYLTLGDGIQPAYSTRNFTANILHQNQHNPREVIKMVLGL